MVPAIACDPHGYLDVKEGPRAEIGRCLEFPVLDLVRVEDYHPPALVVYPSPLVFRVFNLFSPRALALSCYASGADVDLTSFLRCKFLGIPAVLRRFSRFPDELRSALRSF
jgi:hypothetical protein